MTDNAMKLLMTPEDLHNLKNTSIALEKYELEILKPFRDSVSGEIRRYINIHRKIELAMKETERMLTVVKTCLGEK